MNRGTTIGELRWPDTPDFMEVARAWRSNADTMLANLVWEAYDLLLKEVVLQIDVTAADSQIERSITQSLALRIDRVMSGDEPFQILHGAYEFATAHSRKSQPPLYDLAFCLLENERVMWPLEAKVIRSSGAIAPYIAEITDQYMSQRYAPFSSEAGMLAYLFGGDAETFFSNIAQKLKQSLSVFNADSGRPHRTSTHVASVSTANSVKKHFTCHHLVLLMDAAPDRSPKIP